VTWVRPPPVRPSVVAVLALALTLAGCSTPELTCTDIGSPNGVGVTVERTTASGLDGLELRICPGQSTTRGCQTSSVALDPGSDSVDQGCDATEPDAACSATVVPNGSLVGFVDVAWLSPGPVTVMATTTRNGNRRTFPAIGVSAEAVYPNGRACGATGNQARVTLRSDGLH